MEGKPLVFVHKAVERGNLTKPGVLSLTNLLTGNTMADATLWLKYDGVYVQFQHQYGEWRAYSRTGERLLSAETPDRLQILNHKGETNRVYIGELFNPKMEHSEINGLARRKAPQAVLSVYLHDSFNIRLINEHGIDPTTHLHRMQHASRLAVGFGADKFAVAHQLEMPRFADHIGLDERWDILLGQAKDAKQFYGARGMALDGLILRDDGFGFVPGPGYGGGIFKLKPRPSLELRIVGEHAEQRDTKLGGYITVEYKGQRTDVGSGLEQQELSAILRFASYGETWAVGRVAEIEFLDFTKDGKLREPVLKAFRFDKEKADGE